MIIPLYASILCLNINNRFTCLFVSDPVKQEFNRTVILPHTKYNCLQDQRTLTVWLTSCLFFWGFSYVFTCLVESNPVIQEVKRIFIVPIMLDLMKKNVKQLKRCLTTRPSSFQARWGTLTQSSSTSETWTTATSRCQIRSGEGRTSVTSCSSWRAPSMICFPTKSSEISSIGKHLWSIL